MQFEFRGTLRNISFDPPVSFVLYNKIIFKLPIMPGGKELSILKVQRKIDLGDCGMTMNTI